MKRVPLATVEKVLGLHRDKYLGWNVAHFVEKLQGKKGIALSYSWVKKAVVEQQGCFRTLYTDRASHFAIIRKVEGEPDREAPTQVGQALQLLEIDLVLAHSHQARRRCERLLGTWQGRLPQELRLRGIRTIEGGQAAGRFQPTGSLSRALSLVSFGATAYGKVENPKPLPTFPQARRRRLYFSSPQTGHFTCPRVINTGHP